MSMVIAGFASTAKAEVNGEVQYIFNTLSFMFHGVLVFWMAAGFAMLEAGSGSLEEHHHAVAQEHRFVLGRCDHVLPDRLQRDVCRR